MESLRVSTTKSHDLEALKAIIQVREIQTEALVMTLKRSGTDRVEFNAEGQLSELLSEEVTYSHIV